MTDITSRYRLPFMTGDDPLSNVDEIMQSLAEATEKMTKAGSVTVTTAALAQYGNTATQTVNFPEAFDVAPDSVQLQCSNGRLSTGLLSVSESGFTFNLTNLHTAAATGTWTVYWEAVGAVA